ncbi:MAG: transglutaminase-like cysteine peptidase [Rhodospirillales bacterium]|nr:transglutaminase-like cysteine peptidase [Rhodospirillales bacterium]
MSLLSQIVSSSRRLLRTVIVAAAVLAPLALPSIGAADTAQPSFFNSREVRSTDISRFKKWNGALQRYEAENGHDDTDRIGQWHAFLESIRSVGKSQQLSEINDYMNRRRYITDDNNWGINDYWATPAEFLGRSAGDCEDYAIAKFISLKTLGWSDDELRIVAVKDLRKGIGHAIVVAFLEGQALVLDNQSDAILRADDVSHYQPVYSINTKSWWLHRKGRGL